MKKLLVGLALFALTLPLVGGDAAATKPLQGTWQIVAIRTQGKDAPKAFLDKKGFRATFTADRYRVEEADGTFVEEGAYKIDAAAKPARIEFDIVKGKEKGPQLGIYKVEGDALTLCVAPVNALARPKGFDSADATADARLTMKRKKAE